MALLPDRPDHPIEGVVAPARVRPGGTAVTLPRVVSDQLPVARSALLATSGSSTGTNKDAEYR